MKLKIAVSGVSIGKYTPAGCSSCIEIVSPGQLMMLYDDGEYFPTFCTSCVDGFVAEFTSRRASIAEILEPAR